MLVYKYVLPDRIDVLENGSIRFTQADALNDPFEVSPTSVLFEQSIRDEWNKILASPGRLEPIHLLKGDERFKFMQREMEKIFKIRTGEFYDRIRKENVILSLSKERNNLAMWSHYTDMYQGFVLGFDSRHSFFQRPSNKTTVLMDVVYSSERPALPSANPAEVNDTELDEYFNRIYFTKSSHWEYEHELRMLAPSAFGDNIGRDNHGWDIFLFEFPSECLREIIFGYRMSSGLKQEISSIVERYPHVRLYEAQLSGVHFDLDIKPYQKQN